MRSTEAGSGNKPGAGEGESGRRQTPRLVVLVGPTAVGKTEISLQLAERLGGEIVSADSRLLYRGMDIGTAKPSQEERLRVPHHLIDVAEPDDTWSLAVFQRAAFQAIAEIQARGNLPFLVGGTGQYIWAAIEGWDIPAGGPDLRLREALLGWAGEVGLDGLHARLAVLDPEAAGRIDPRNLRRTVRALEVILTTGQRFSEQRRRAAPAHQSLMLGLNRPRPELYARIDARIEAMLEEGLVEEVRDLLEKGYSLDLPAMSAIGYQEIGRHLQGELSLEEAVVLIKRRTRQFVRRQVNWFKETDPAIHWSRVSSETIHELESLIRLWLAGER